MGQVIELKLNRSIDINGGGKEEQSIELRLRLQVSEFKTWTTEQVRVAIDWYTYFLMAHAQNLQFSFIPPAFVDAIWRAHIASGSLYEKNCEEMLGGHLYRFPKAIAEDYFVWEKVYSNTLKRIKSQFADSKVFDERLLYPDALGFDIAQPALSVSGSTLAYRRMMR